MYEDSESKMDDIVDKNVKRPTRNKSSQATVFEDFKQFKRKTPNGKQLSTYNRGLKGMGAMN